MIALLDWHQTQETTARGEKKGKLFGEKTAANPSSFSPERQDLLDADLQIVIKTFQEAGLKPITPIS